MQNNIVSQDNNKIKKININDNNYTLIKINNRIYAIKTQEILEIVKIMEFEYLKNLPSCVLGLIKYENNPVPVIDLREVFKDKRIVYDLSAKVIIIQTKERIISIICDEIVDVKKLNKAQISTLPYKESELFYSGIYINQQESAYILDFENILKYTEEHYKEFSNDGEKKSYIVDDEESTKILKDRKNFLVRVNQEIQLDTALYDMGVSFSINNIKYYINMASVREFYKINNSKFIKVPSTPDFIRGLINIKGEYITVLDLRLFFGNSKTEIKEKSTIIILNSSEYKLGILADEICESMNVNFDEIIENRLQSADETLTMEFVQDGEIYQVVDIEQLFKNERLAIV